MIRIPIQCIWIHHNTAGYHHIVAAAVGWYPGQQQMHEEGLNIARQRVEECKVPILQYTNKQCSGARAAQFGGGYATLVPVTIDRMYN